MTLEELMEKLPPTFAQVVAHNETTIEGLLDNLEQWDEEILADKARDYIEMADYSVAAIILLIADAREYILES